jgi:S-DNA-T family DNA segregation ATPase FtsK/SpoIIIE
MAKKKSKKTSNVNEKFSVQGRDTSEIRGILLVAFSLIVFMSLVSFAFDSPSTNLFGLMGQNLGWIFHSLFGLGSYLICLYAGWRGFCLMTHRQLPYSGMGIANFLAIIASLCILLSLVEDQLPTIGNVLQSSLYPSLWARKMHYHLGGALFYYFYHDLPGFNFYRIFSSVGVAVIFGSLLIANLLIFCNLSIAKLIALAKSLRPEPKPLAVVDTSTEPVFTAPPKEESSFLRYVKLRIPNSSTTPTTPTPTSSSQHELLAIQPETNLTARPSLSNKNLDRSSEELANEKKKSFLPEALPQKKPIDIPFPRPSPVSSKEQRRQDALSAQRIENGDFTNYAIPPATMLSSANKVDQSSLKKDLKRQAEVLEETLHSFGIEAKVGQINCGPTINSFEVHPAIGVKVQRIKALEDDIALNMEAKSIRIIAPIPGKAAVGIEVPNPQPQEVSFREMLQSYQQGPKKFHIPVLLGKAVNGDYVMTDLTKMPHCIIAGATGSGKSVCINTIVMSILLNAKPDEIKMIMIDPKKVELTPYTRLPHMLAPVITEPHGACAALHWLVKEMEKRYETLKLTGNRNIETFNNRTINKELEDSLNRDIPAKMHYIVCIVDELADLMMVSSSDIETPIARIAQMARAVGIHLILATQRPSREVITGLIKANFPTRIAFKVASRVNSQIILDETGAESLLGNGDMLFLPPGSSHLIRAQGALIRDEDINAITTHLCSQASPRYEIASFDSLEKSEWSGSDEGSPLSTTSADTMYDQALDIVQSTGNASTTFLQRKLKIGYARAASLIDELEANGVVGQADGSKARRVLKFKNEAENEDE